MTDYPQCICVEKHCVHDQLDEAKTKIERLTEALTMLYEKYEDGPPCTENGDEDGSILGNAVELSADEEDQILRLIPPLRADAALTQPAAKEEK